MKGDKLCSKCFTFKQCSHTLTYLKPGNIHWSIKSVVVR